MKNARSLIMLIIAALAGLAAVVLAARWIQQQTQASAGKVAVAVMDVQLGERLRPEMIMLVDWPAGSVPPGTHHDPALLDGRVVRSSLTRGEPILEAKLAPKGARGGLSAVVAEGKRAITVRVNDVVGVAGFALPGTFVDIMVSTQEEGARSNNKDNAISKIVLEQILVLAIAQEASRDETRPRVVSAVTLEVTPEQAEILDLARSVGTLSLVLRNQIDRESIQTPGATKTTLLGQGNTSASASQDSSASSSGASPRSARPPTRTPTRSSPPRSTQCVEVIRGKTRSLECF